MLCLCKMPGQDRLAVRLLLVQTGPVGSAAETLAAMQTQALRLGHATALSSA
jgi:hypothetical protein